MKYSTFSAAAFSILISASSLCAATEQTSPAEAQMIQATIELVSQLIPCTNKGIQSPVDSTASDLAASLSPTFTKRYPLVDFTDPRMTPILRMSIGDTWSTLVPFVGSVGVMALLFGVKLIKDRALGIQTRVNEAIIELANPQGADEQNEHNRRYVNFSKRLKLFYEIKMALSSAVRQPYYTKNPHHEEEEQNKLMKLHNNGVDISNMRIEPLACEPWRVYQEDMLYAQEYSTHPVRGVIDRGVLPAIPLILGLATALILPHAQKDLAARARAYIVDGDENALKALAAMRTKRAWGIACLIATATSSIPAFMSLANTIMTRHVSTQNAHSR